MPAVGLGQQYVQFYACRWLGAAVCAILCLLFGGWAVGLGGGQVPPPALKSTQEGEVYMIKLSDEREAEFFPRGRKLYDDVLTKI